MECELAKTAGRAVERRPVGLESITRAEGWDEGRHGTGKHSVPRNGSRAAGLLGAQVKSLC